MTSRQAELLRFICAYQVEHGGMSPTFAEMGKAMGGLGRGAIYATLTRLESHGIIRRSARQARGIEVVVSAAAPRLHDPDFVEAAMARGYIAKPPIDAIINLYGADALSARIAAQDPTR